MTIGEFAAVFGIIATFLAVFQWQVSKRQLGLQVMEHVHVRYCQLQVELERLPLLGSLATLSPDQTRVVSAYFNLCAEEFYWYRERHITHAVWAVWLLGMAETLRHPLFTDAWRQRFSRDYYYPGFAEFVEALHEQSSRIPSMAISRSLPVEFPELDDAALEAELRYQRNRAGPSTSG